jgi:dTDP-glucose 4,6-dehydratase
MKILVLGGSSFSGRAFIAHAARSGHDVADLSHPKWDLNGNLPKRAAELVRMGYDSVVNFIALNIVATSWTEAPAYYRTNVVGLATLCDALIGCGAVQRFLEVSTPEVYGHTGVRLREGQSFNPSTPYALSRAAADMHLKLLHQQHGFPVIWTRTVNVYGPGQQPYRIIPRTIGCILAGERLPLEGGGVSTRSFIHIADAAEAYLRALESGKSGEAYHVATERQTSIRDLVAMICERMGAKFSDVVQIVPERPGKDMNYHLDDSKIRRELGWFDRIPLEQGVEQVINAFRHVEIA